MQTIELSHHLIKQALSNAASIFFLNSAPGSGKSHLLRYLANELPADIPYSYTLGPYTVTANTTGTLGRQMLDQCHRAAFVDAVPADADALDLTGAWRWLGQNIYVRGRQTFLILLDLAEPGGWGSAQLGTLFSDVRRLEGEWDHDNVSLLFLVAGYWDHPALKEYYLEIETSFPYTPEKNYAIWEGLTLGEIGEMVRRAHPGETQPLHGRLLHELTAGHVGAAVDILAQVPAGQLSLTTLLNATRDAAAAGPTGKRLLASWRDLPEKAHKLINALLLRQHETVPGNPAYLDQLEAAGVIRLERLGLSNYTSFRSWYVELVVRLHAETLDFADERVRRIRIEDLIPPITELNVEAYRIINNVENHARNFIAGQLLTEQNGQSILQHPIARRQLVNGHEDATEWKEKQRRKDLQVELNPLHCYLTTRELAALIHGIANQFEYELKEAWRQIAYSIEDMADVRDAVMHNQLIGDAELQKLYELQADIYNALSKT